ncbi:DoxX-like family protein [Paenibacillus terrigena]|uniref:DoxX-like family protein n=1 Tax=Paenibacillus terrigena TaxID=369333 RepID=UPI0028D0D12C|nr:DoxX-like family protein [Paenibacillus terrigena]
MTNKPIYVERIISTDMDTLWYYTQTPDVHQQWDLRFTEIEYLPKHKESDLQRFLYRTNIGFGVSIAGEGETSGVQEKDGSRTSVLRFASDQWISLIREGAGFWKYVPMTQGVRFFTRYDYRTRFGVIGKLLDLLLFRPLMGWATAWSFDALRLWIEKGIHPRISLLRSLTDLVCTLVLCMIWIYQGVFPKILYPETGELAILQGTLLFQGYESLALITMGILEVIFGLLFLIMGLNRRKIMYIWNIGLLILLGMSGVLQPELYVAPFNPVTLNFGMIALSVVGLLSLPDLPRASNCLRRPNRSRMEEEA